MFHSGYKLNQGDIAAKMGEEDAATGGPPCEGGNCVVHTGAQWTGPVAGKAFTGTPFLLIDTYTANGS